MCFAHDDAQAPNVRVRSSIARIAVFAGDLRHGKTCTNQSRKKRARQVRESSAQSMTFRNNGNNNDDNNGRAVVPRALDAFVVLSLGRCTVK